MGTRQIFDADNHYYEALDAFTRYLDPSVARRIFRWATIDGRSYPIIGGRVFEGVKNATFDPVAPAGVLADYFRGNPNGDDPLELLRRHEPIRPEYRDRDARLATMDDQGIDRMWLFPTLAMIYEEALTHDRASIPALFTAFNRWLADDWGFDYKDRIFAAPYISLSDPDWATTELTWAIDNGARSIVMRPAAAHTVAGSFSVADRRFDPFWSLLNESGITLVVHAGDAGYTSHGYAIDGFTTDFGIPQPIRMLQLERPIEDFLSALICDNLFHRFPRLRVASVENGSKFLDGLFGRLGVVARKMNGWFPEDPVETFRRHIWINPFWEDHIDDVVATMGSDRVIFGSDWPHIEGLPEPTQYCDEVAHLGDADQARIVWDNAVELNSPLPA